MVKSADELLSRYGAGERDFRGARLAYAVFVRPRGRVDLSGVNLSGSDLTKGDFRRVDFSRANLTFADFTSADLRGAILDDAILDDAILSGANLGAARLARATFRRISLGSTFLCRVHLGSFCRAQVDHNSPSTVDFESILDSLGEPRLKEFLRATGMPDVFVEYMVDCARSLDPQQVFSLLQSTFISYGGPDEAFARKLNDALKRRGVTTFFFKDDAPAGEKLHRVMRKGVNEHDRVILVCSESSLRRPGLLNELEETITRESRDGGRTYLLPVRLDDYVINGWKPADSYVAQAVRDRVIADFRQHTNPATFEAEVSKLIAVLKRPAPVGPA